MSLSQQANRFWAQVEIRGPEDCWSWVGGKFQSGYGYFRYSRKLLRAHRVAWLIAKGEIPDELNVLHSCDHPACVNPNHLFLGTDADNMNDKVAKGRARGAKRGEMHHKARLTTGQVAEIR